MPDCLLPLPFGKGTEGKGLSGRTQKTSLWSSSFRKTNKDLRQQRFLPKRKQLRFRAGPLPNPLTKGNYIVDSPNGRLKA